MFENLLSPYKIGKLTIKNRFCMGPMGTPFFDSNGVYTEHGIQYHVERAKGGFGLIFTGVHLVDHLLDPFDPTNPPGWWSSPNKYAREARRLNERCAAYGTKVFVQLGMGSGRNYPGMRAPSPVEVFQYPQFKGIELTVDEIKIKQEQMIKAAAVMKRAGYSGIEVHAMHWGYLLDEMAMAITNRRTDEYGGTLENRMRCIKEIIQGIKQECGSDYPVTVRLGIKSYIKALNKASLDGSDEAGRTLEEGIEICRMLEQYGVDALSLDTGVYDSFYYACPPCYMPQGHGIDLYAQAKAAVNIPILAGSRMQDPYMAEQAIKDGAIDAVVLSRPSLADPCLPRKVQMGKPEKIRPCIGCVNCLGRLLDTREHAACAVNPEALFGCKLAKATDPKKVIIVGGGVAGMEAARAAKKCGHDVTLYEKTGELGGNLISAGAHSFKKEVRQLNAWYKAELEELNVPVHLNTTATPEMILSQKPDAIILAQGSTPVMPKSIPGIDNANVYSSIDAILGQHDLGENVVVVGAGLVGSELAVDLAMNEGKKVTLVEALDKILTAGPVTPTSVNMMLNDMIDYYGVSLKTGHCLKEIKQDSVVLAPVNGGDEITVQADSVVICVGFTPNPSMASALYESGAAVYEIGDGAGVANILNATQQAYEVASSL